MVIRFQKCVKTQDLIKNRGFHGLNGFKLN